MTDGAEGATTPHRVTRSQSRATLAVPGHPVDRVAEHGVDRFVCRVVVAAVVTVGGCVASAVKGAGAMAAAKRIHARARRGETARAPGRDAWVS